MPVKISATTIQRRLMRCSSPGGGRLVDDFAVLDHVRDAQRIDLGCLISGPAADAGGIENRQVGEIARLYPAQLPQVQARGGLAGNLVNRLRQREPSFA